MKPPPPDASLLAPDDPPPFEQINPDGSAHLVLVCDHAGRNIPAALNGLGVPDEDMGRHIACDIGARAVTRHLSGLMDAAAFMHNYSRLVIDCNRPVGHIDSIPETSDNTTIPGNRCLSPVEAHKRERALFWPYHNAISREIGRRWRTEGVPPVLFSVHSFSPGFGDRRRPWDAGVLYNRDTRVTAPLLEALRGHGLHMGDNEPYSGRELAYTLNVHATSTGIACGCIEINQDQIATPEGQEHWARLLADTLRPIITREHMFRIEWP